MQILKRLQSVCILFTFAAAAVAQEVPITVSGALHRAEIPARAVGMYVQEISSGEVLVSSNETLPLNPASVMKLVTSNAALEVLGPTFSWKTEAYGDGVLDEGALHGDLIIKGSGDPSLVIENLWLFLRRIRAAGVREIRGDLVLDRTVFEEIAHDPAQFDGDPTKPYNVGPDALLLGFKALTFHFRPDPVNATVRVMSDPQLADFPLIPPVLEEGDCGDWRNKLLATIDDMGARFNGTYPASCGERIWHVHPYELTHTQYFEMAFRRLWTELGGTLLGQAREGAVPESARLLADWESAALPEVIRDINKYSNNVMARQLLLTMAYQVLQLPANTERGSAVVRSWLSEKGIDAPELSIENGSGLSRTERVSALTLGRMLVAAFRSPLMPEFIASLPLAGRDGTMRRRLNGYPVAGNAHIKTGYLDEVRSIAGYVLAASGKRYAVVCIINHPNAVRGKAAQDALLQWVHEQG